LNAMRREFILCQLPTLLSVCLPACLIVSLV
jgi:hypothetical protein